MHPIGIAREATSCKVTRWLAGVLAALLIMVASATAQTCLAGDEIDAATRGGLEKAGHQYFNWTATGDVASMRQNAIPAVASDFSGIETAVKDNQSNFAGTQATVRPPSLSFRASRPESTQS
jgi:hypothetical protein